MDESVKAAIQDDGGLYNLGWYLSWEVGDDDATLDGVFKAQQLIDIGNYIRTTQVRA